MAIDAAVAALRPLVGTQAACAAVGRPRASYYRDHRVSPAPPPPPRPPRAPHPRALTPPEREQVLAVLHAERFADAAPATVYATLLDEGVYLASEATMYRLLRERGQTGDRRRHAVHPPRVKPELVATAPNQVWSWDITKLHGPAKWTYYYLYVILDTFSRYTVGWMVADGESAKLAERLLGEAIATERVGSNELTVHADRGTSMTSKPVALLLADLGVTRSHSRPKVSNDNPYSESQFKTLKHVPTFPGSFASIQDARAFCAEFFDWYNHAHRHSGIGLLTPSDVHHGRAQAVTDARARVLRTAYQQHPERFVRKPPEPPQPPGEVWINKPTDPSDQAQ